MTNGNFSLAQRQFRKFGSFCAADPPGKAFLIVDHLRVHHAKIIKAWVEQHPDRIELFYLPPYAPGSNPDECLNHDFKTSLRLEPPSRDDSELLKKARTVMERMPQSNDIRAGLKIN